MAITFALRGDQLDARYAPAGAAASALGGTPAVVNSTVAGINGSTSIDMNGGASAVRPLAYIGRSNLPANAPMSVLLRVYMTDVATSRGLFEFGLGGRQPAFGLIIYLHSSNQMRSIVIDESTTSSTNTSTTSLLTVNTWHDIVWTWDGTTDANSLKFYLDATLDSQTQPTVAWPDLSDYDALRNQILIGSQNDALDESAMYVDEVVVWDEIIDPTSGGLNLNGASRSSYVTVSVQDGTPSGGGGAGLSLGTPGLRL